MILKLPEKPKPPSTKRIFANPWAELDYLCKKISHWLYVEGHKARAGHYRNRLERVLDKLPENELAILREEGLALLCELKGEKNAAIKHRKREIQLMERLHREAQAPKYTDSTRAYMLHDRDTNVLDERRAILDGLMK